LRCRYTYVGETHYRRLLAALEKHGKIQTSPDDDADNDYLYFAYFDGDAVEAFLCLTCDRRFKSAIIRPLTSKRLRRRE
jgi:hypothetical protein